MTDAYFLPLGDGRANVGYGEVLRGQTLSRAHLLNRLAHSAARLTLVVAPPGFGKSTLLAGWLAQVQGAARLVPGARRARRPALAPLGRRRGLERLGGL